MGEVIKIQFGKRAIERPYVIDNGGGRIPVERVISRGERHTVVEALDGAPVRVLSANVVDGRADNETLA